VTLPSSGAISLGAIYEEWSGVTYKSSVPGSAYGNPSDLDNGTPATYNLGSYYKRSDISGPPYSTLTYQRVFPRGGHKISNNNPYPSIYGTIPVMSGAISFSNFYGTQLGET
jgi:hypothetical protein